MGMYWTVRRFHLQYLRNSPGRTAEVTVITVEKEDMPQKGKILVSKTGEEFSSVQVSGDGVVDKDGNLAEGENIYTPVYAVTGQAGAVYEVIAAEDIVTPDGTVRANAGECGGYHYHR